MRTSEVLRNAQARVARGWTQGTAGRGGTADNPREVCAVGAIRLATGAALTVVPEDFVGSGTFGVMIPPSAAEYAAVLAVAAIVADPADRDPVSRWNRVVHWNNATERTQAEVVAAFDAAAAIEEAKEGTIPVVVPAFVPALDAELAAAGRFIGRVRAESSRDVLPDLIDTLTI